MTAIRKQKVSKACDSCKARKKKCDGTQPCPSCVSRGISCSYIIEDKRRTRYGYGFFESSPASSGNANSHGSSDKPPFPSPPIELQVDINKIPASLRSLLNLPEDIPKRVVKKSEEQLSPASQTPERTTSSKRRQGRSHKFNYVGHSAAIAYLITCRDIISRADLLDMSKTSFMKELRPFKTENHLSIELRSNPLEFLPDREYADFLVNLFNQNINQMIYVLNFDYMKINILEEVYANPAKASKPKLCLLYVILAVGSIFAQALQKVSPQSVRYAKIADSTVYARCALYLLQFSDSEPSLQMIEIQYAFMFYHLFSNRPFILWVNLGTAIRDAQLLGLNQVFINNSYKDKPYMLHRKRLWRSLFIADLLLSPMIGQPVMIQDYSLPSLSEPIVLNRDFVEECEHQMVKISVLNSRTFQAVYHATQDLTFHTLKHLAICYHQWAFELPYELRLEAFLLIDKSYDHAKETINTKYAYHPFYFLYLIKLYGVELLSRPCIEFIIMRRLHEIEFGNHDGFGTISRNSFIINFANTCYKAAKFTIFLSDFFWERRLRPDKPSAFVSFIFTSGLTVGMVFYTQVAQRLMERKLNDDELEFFKEDNESFLLNAIKLLREFSSVDASSERYYDILNNMYFAIKERETGNTTTNDEFQTSEEYNVQRNFGDLLFPNIEDFNEDSQADDIHSFNQFLNKYYRKDQNTFFIDGMF